MAKLFNFNDFSCALSDLCEDKENDKFQPLLEDILKLFLLKDNEKLKNTDMLDLYKIVGFDTFLNILDYFSGRSIRIPKKEVIKDAVLASIYIYYCDIKGYDKSNIEEIAQKLSDDYGIKVLKERANYIKKYINKVIEDARKQ